MFNVYVDPVHSRPASGSRRSGNGSYAALGEFVDLRARQYERTPRTIDLEEYYSRQHQQEVGRKHRAFCPVKHLIRYKHLARCPLPCPLAYHSCEYIRARQRLPDDSPDSRYRPQTVLAKSNYCLRALYHWCCLSRIHIWTPTCPPVGRMAVFQWPVTSRHRLPARQRATGTAGALLLMYGFRCRDSSLTGFGAEVVTAPAVSQSNLPRRLPALLRIKYVNEW
ncbi:hypothetical protein EVAR_12874_1 [Eumeta japonica]|uniref:Uncharacterized protein n=1 Tax=Eumeta variegata TaxID=151549 RepID=A0A4C1TVN3_EUMVA|nr:hypothetical protein EVAR_12874_1 [Eumeta japonica]